MTKYPYSMRHFMLHQLTLWTQPLGKTWPILGKVHFGITGARLGSSSIAVKTWRKWSDESASMLGTAQPDWPFDAHGQGELRCPEWAVGEARVISTWAEAAIFTSQRSVLRKILSSPTLKVCASFWDSGKVVDFAILHLASEFFLFIFMAIGFL